MTVFVDTSAIYAFLDRDERRHSAVAAAFETVVGREQLVTHSHVLVESVALLKRRTGIDGVRAFVERVEPELDVVWVDADLHAAARAALLAADRRDVSLVDWTSFEVMRRLRIETAIAFDDDFAAQGFHTLP